MDASIGATDERAITRSGFVTGTSLTTGEARRRASGTRVAYALGNHTNIAEAREAGIAGMVAVARTGDFAGGAALLFARA